MKNMNILFLTFLLSISMCTCMEVGLGSVAESGKAGAEREWWNPLTWFDCSTEKAGLKQDCCLYRNCQTSCNLNPNTVQSSFCHEGCNMYQCDGKKCQYNC